MRSILSGERTLKLVRDAVQVEPVPALDLKGKSEPVPAFRLLAIADRSAGPSPRLSAPLIGRGAELGQLRGAFDRAVAERTSIDTVRIAGMA